MSEIWRSISQLLDYVNVKKVELEPKTSWFRAIGATI